MGREHGGTRPRPKGEVPIGSPESGITGRRALEKFLDVPEGQERNVRVMAAGIDAVLIGDFASRSLLIASEGRGTSSEAIRRFNERSRLLRRARGMALSSPQLGPEYIRTSHEFTRNVAAVYLQESANRVPQAAGHQSAARNLAVVADASLNMVEDFRELT